MCFPSPVVHTASRLVAGVWCGVVLHGQRATDVSVQPLPVVTTPTRTDHLTPENIFKTISIHNHVHKFVNSFTNKIRFKKWIKEL